MAFTTFEEWFIGESGVDIVGRTPTTPEDFENPQQTVTWAKIGTGIVEIDNNILVENVPDYFRAITPSGLNARYYTSEDGPTNQSIKMRFASVSTGLTSLFVGMTLLPSGDTTDLNDWSFYDIRHNGSTLNVWKSTANEGSAQTVSTEGRGNYEIAEDRVHLLEVELNGSTLDVWIDQELAFTVAVDAAFTGRKIGFRLNANATHGIEWIKATDYVAPPSRIYFDPSNAGAGTVGDIADPYKVQATAEAALANNTRLCMKSGELCGAGWNIPALTGVEVFPYGSNAAEDGFDCSDTTTLAIGAFTPSGSEHYYATSNTAIVLIEEDGTSRTRMEGTSEATIGNPKWKYLTIAVEPDPQDPDYPHYVEGGVDHLPVVGSLQPGQWAYDTGNSRIYMRPFGDVTGSKNWILGKSSSVPMTIQNVTGCTIYGAKCWGTPASNAQLFAANGSTDLNFWWCDGSLGGWRGITVGEGDVHTRPRVYFCSSDQCISKGVGTQGPAPTKQIHDGVFFGNYNSRVGAYHLDIHDTESLMTIPHTYDTKVYFTKSYQIGYLGDSFGWPTGYQHPVGISNDGGTRNTYAYNRTYQTRCGFNIASSETHDATDIHIYNNLVKQCGDKADTVRVRPHAAFHLRTVEDRNDNSTPRQMINCVIEHNSVIDCSFPNSGTSGHGIFSAQTKNQSGDLGGALSGVIRYNLVDDANSEKVFAYESDGADNVDIASHSNVLYASGITTAGTHTGNSGNQSWSTLANLQDRADSINGSGLLGNRDTNSVIADPNTDADGRPQSGSNAIGLAVGSKITLDLTLKPRVNNVAGCFED